MSLWLATDGQSMAAAIEACEYVALHDLLSLFVLFFFSTAELTK